MMSARHDPEKQGGRHTLMGGPLHVPLVGAHRRNLRLELGDAVPLLGA